MTTNIGYKSLFKIYWYPIIYGGVYLLHLSLMIFLNDNYNGLESIKMNDFSEEIYGYGFLLNYLFFILTYHRNIDSFKTIDKITYQNFFIFTFGILWMILYFSMTPDEGLGIVLSILLLVLSILFNSIYGGFLHYFEKLKIHTLFVPLIILLNVGALYKIVELVLDMDTEWYTSIVYIVLLLGVLNFVLLKIIALLRRKVNLKQDRLR